MGFVNRYGLGKAILIITCAILVATSAINIWWTHLQAEKEAHIMATDTAMELSETILRSLNTMMVQGTIGERDVFLDSMKIMDGLKEIRVIRGQPVIDQFGEGLEEEKPKDDIERRVLQTGQPEFLLLKDENNLRAVIPFVVSEERVKKTGFNCFDCHDVQEGAVNGALSLKISLENSRKAIARSDMSMATFYLLELLVILAIFWQVIRTQINRKLSSVVMALNDASHSLNEMADEMTSSSQSLAEGSAEQATALEESSATIDHLSEKAVESSTNAGEANNIMTMTQAKLSTGVQEMGEIIKAMEEIQKSSNEISKVIGVIEQIAFQTNLLALNAAVEAARAGEHGKGFSVVAEEVRNLSHRTSTASKETAEMIQNAAIRSEQGTKIITQASVTLQEISKSTRQAADFIKEISLASSSQSQEISGVTNAVKQIDKVTQSNAKKADDVSGLSRQLSTEAEDLKETINNLCALISGTSNER